MVVFVSTSQAFVDVEFLARTNNPEGTKHSFPSQIPTCENLQAPSDGVIQITAVKAAGGKRKRGGGRGGDGPTDGRGFGRDWPGGNDRYVRFVLRKENMDTQVGCMDFLSFPCFCYFSHRVPAATRCMCAACCGRRACTCSCCFDAFVLPPM